MAKLSHRAGYIKGAGEAAFGARWQSSLSRASGVPQSLLAMIAGGEREPTDDVYRKVAQGLKKASLSMQMAALKLDVIADKMLAELEK
jgi:predicted transcriptional regulator